MPPAPLGSREPFDPPPGPRPEDWLGLGDEAIGSLSPPMQDMLRALLLYKSVFVAPWFQALGAEETPETRAIYESIARETRAEAMEAASLIRRWDESASTGAARDVTEHVLRRLLEDLLELKKSSTEVFLAAGIRSPNEELRRAFLQLASIDQRHANELRAALGVKRPEDHLPESHAAGHSATGAHVGPFKPGTLSGAIRRSVEESQAAGHEPSRIVASALALRHLRDEGSVEPAQGTAFGLPVDVDFSWGGECFAVTSRSRLSLAEIAIQMAEDRAADRMPGRAETHPHG
ncbi:MAG: hypothetical protein QOE90_3747 [Thermoplasmata archaeon]|jgi:rubrerythrin|nr:hypothetical protein [Thermoplasmata archaeon]